MLLSRVTFFCLYDIRSQKVFYFAPDICIEKYLQEGKMETTIAAISTAMSASGIGIIRISGENAMDVISRIYRSKGGKKKIKEVPTHTIHYRYIYDGEGLIDEVLVMIMHAPRTFTGEDTVEIDCHGGVFAMQRVLETVLKNGAEIAEPGEFTKRAFLNGGWICHRLKRSWT